MNSAAPAASTNCSVLVTGASRNIGAARLQRLFAIDTFTVGLAREAATQGVRVNAVRPGSADEVAAAIVDVRGGR